MDVTQDARRRRTHRADLFSPDIVTAAQWYHDRQHTRSPERRLLAAVLEDALDILRNYARYRHSAGIMRPEVFKGWRLWSDTQAWLADGERADCFGARPICDVLGIDYDAVVTAMARRDWVPGVAVTRSVRFVETRPCAQNTVVVG